MTPDEARAEIQASLLAEFGRADWAEADVLVVPVGDDELNLDLREFVQAFVIAPDEGRTHLGELAKQLRGNSQLQERRAERIASYDAASPHLRLLLQPDTVGDEVAAVSETWMPGVETALAIDVGGGQSLIEIDEMMEWGVGRKQVLADARERTWESLADLQRQEALVENTATVQVLISPSNAGSSGALFIERLYPEAEHGVLFSVPDVQVTFAHVIAGRGRLGFATGFMVQQTLARHQELPGAISPHLYWARGGRVEQITLRTQGEQGQIEGSPEFALMLASLPE